MSDISKEKFNIKTLKALEISLKHVEEQEKIIEFFKAELRLKEREHKDKIAAYIVECSSMGSKIESLKAENEKLREGLEFINDTAPAMYEYNEVELRMVLKAREILAEIDKEGEE